MDINLAKLLEKCLHLSQVQVRETRFGSNGHIEQPARIVESFTKCTTKRLSLKYFINSNYEFTHLNVHHATFANKEHDLRKFLVLEDNYFMLNHYSCQSRNFWRDVKCTRNDCDNYRIRNMDGFAELDLNEVEDLRLAIQSREPRFKR
jgi:hypothetical protein